MKSLFKKAKAEIGEFLDSQSSSDRTSNIQKLSQGQDQPRPPSTSGTDQDQPSLIQEPNALDILRYRYHHGTNLGSIFVLERWLTPSMFPESATGTSELEAVKAWVETIGIDATRQKFEEHWANAVSDGDIQWLSEEAKGTTVRLPIGYWDLDCSLLHGTPFAPYDVIYKNAFTSILSLISRFRAHSIGVLLDLHALPGGANSEEHSGTNFGVTQLWNSQANRDLGIRCCKFIADEVTKGSLPIVGIQIINEAASGSHRMYEWYDQCIETISQIDPSIPVVISDAWNLGQAVEYSLKKNTAFPSHPIAPVVIDTHHYWCFSDDDKRRTPQAIIHEVGSKLSEIQGQEGSIFDRGAVQTIVGEYSCVLSEETWTQGGAASKSDLVKQFGNAQSKRYQEKSGGAFFWTWKMDWAPGGEWDFGAQTYGGSITPSTIQTISQSLIPSLLEKAQQRRDETMHEAVSSHCVYWNNSAPEPWDHWRYENGWRIGFQDALSFFEGKGSEAVFGGNQIGNFEIWILKRVRESGQRGKFVWEFEQGLRRGIQDFYRLIGVP